MPWTYVLVLFEDSIILTHPCVTYSNLWVRLTVVMAQVYFESLCSIDACLVRYVIHVKYRFSASMCFGSNGESQDSIRLSVAWYWCCACLIWWQYHPNPFLYHTAICEWSCMTVVMAQVYFESLCSLSRCMFGMSSMSPPSIGSLPWCVVWQQRWESNSPQCQWHGIYCACIHPCCGWLCTW